MCFFNISTTKSGPKLVCFAHFDFEMCFAPQQHALFEHLNFHKCSEHEMHWAFWLGNALRATTACNFSSHICPDGSTPTTLASLLFDPLEPQVIGKNTVFRDSSTFSRTCIFFLLTLSRVWSSFFFSSLLWFFPSLLFHLSILSEVWLLNFLRPPQPTHRGVGGIPWPWVGRGKTQNLEHIWHYGIYQSMGKNGMGLTWFSILGGME